MKRLIVMSLMATCCLTTVLAQKTVVSQKDQKETPFNVVEDKPAFPGGMEAMIQFFSTNIQYPADAKKQKIDGRVLVNFVIEKDGSITDVKVMKPGFPSLDAEAVRVVKMMPKWKPGYQKGQAVRVLFALPISFNLK
ncbi:MAG: energy transducer TonB [Prevotella sp.]|nr:energy transducer TonB [Prevotella sp.]